MWRIAPNVRNFPRVWSVIAFVSLQMWVIYLVFGACERLVLRLLRLFRLRLSILVLI